MICTDCDFGCNYWPEMISHYNKTHPEIKNPYKFFTKEARKK